MTQIPPLLANLLGAALLIAALVLLGLALSRNSQRRVDSFDQHHRDLERQSIRKRRRPF